MQKNNLLHALQKVVLFSLPLSVGSVVNMIIGFASMMMVASFGKNDLAAAALAFSTYMTIMVISTTIFYAVGILIGHQRGQENNPSHIGLIMKNGCWLAMMLSVPAGIILWYIDKLLLLMGQDPSLVAIAQGYFHFAALSMFPVMMNATIAQFYAGIGKPRFTLWLALTSFPFTLLLVYGLVLGHFGLPAMGLPGVMCAGLIVQSLVMCCVIFLLYWQERAGHLSYSIFDKITLPDWSICKSIFTLGLPVGIQFGGELAAMTVSTYLMGYFGATALAAAQIVSQYFMIFVVLILGLTQALSILTSESFGQKDLTAVKGYLHAVICLLVILCLIASILFLFFPLQLTHFYMSSKQIDANLQHLVIIFFAINACLAFFDGMRHILSGSLRGLHDSQGPMRIGIIAMWLVSLPMCYLTGFVYHGGPVGLRLGFFTGFIFAVIFLALRIRKKLAFLKAEGTYS